MPDEVCVKMMPQLKFTFITDAHCACLAGHGVNRQLKAQAVCQGDSADPGRPDAVQHVHGAWRAGG